MILSPLLLAATVRAGEAPSAKVFPADELSGVDVTTERGDIRISGADRLTVKVDLSEGLSYADCDISMRPKGKNLVLAAKKSSKDGCPVGFIIEAPRRMSARATAGTGVVDASHLDGALTASTGAGDVRLTDVNGPIEVKTGAGAVTGRVKARSDISIHTGAGDVRLKDLEGPVEIKTGTGEVTLEYASVPVELSTTSIKTGSAGAAVFLPEGAKFSAHFKSGTGRYATDIAETPEANFYVTMKSGTGSLIINKVKGNNQ